MVVLSSLKSGRSLCPVSRAPHEHGHFQFDKDDAFYSLTLRFSSANFLSSAISF